MWQALKTARKPILLYGMGNGADKILNHLRKLGIAVAGVFASDGFVRHQNFQGYKVVSYSEAKETFGAMIVLVCFGTNRPEVIENIRKIAREQELYAPDVPVYGDGVFDREYCLRHRSELESVYNMLADDISRHTFDSVVRYKLTGKIRYLFRCQTTPEEAYNKILRLSKHESYMDLGAYNGDTVAEFLHFTGGDYDRIIAVEPDKKNFRKLTQSTRELERCECRNVAVSDSCSTGRFAMRSGRNSSVCRQGDEIMLDSVDNMAGGKITYIKMDVEGQERQAISGAETTIREYRPKLLISAYHRNEDLFALPLQIREICPDYSVYFRHYPYIPAWDTNFYFV